MSSSWITAAVWCLFGTLATTLARDNSCAIYSNGCAFHVVLAGKNCVRDGPLTSSYTQMQGDDPKSSFYDRYPSAAMTSSEQNEINKDQLQLDKIVRDELETNSKRLTELEEKLTRMMEGLSVRSLRHFRKIKTDMGAIMSSVRSISKQDGGGGGRSRDGGDGDDDSSRCPPDFVTTGTWDSCYKFSNFNASWDDARDFCSAMGANMVAIETEKEAYILDGLIRTNTALQLPKGWWTAGNYQPRSRQWVWMTRRHARPLDRGFTRWAENEPNARSIMHCMLMYRPADYLWHDGTCTDHHNFICELPIKG